MGCKFTKETSTPPSRYHNLRHPAPAASSGRRHQPSVSTGSPFSSRLEAWEGEREREREEVHYHSQRRPRPRRQWAPDPRQGLPPNKLHGEAVAAGWPDWLSACAAEAIQGWIPRREDSFEKLDKIGQGTYSSVYKARDLMTGKIVALKKVRFKFSDQDSVRFMAREILILRRLDHPNVIKLQGLLTSAASYSLSLVFEYMEHDLAGLAACPGIKFTESQVKCYMLQLMLGLDYCHSRGVIHRDIKGSNLLLDNNGRLKIADFGLATFFDPVNRRDLTNKVVTLWYRAPELLMGVTDYSVGVDLWSAGCVVAELLAGKPIMRGQTEVEQLHKIFKLCGSPSEEYWKKLKLPHTTLFSPQPFERCIRKAFKDFTPSSLSLIETLLAIDPAKRQTAAAALRSEYFTTKPYACDPSSLPRYPPSKEMDAKRRAEEAKRSRDAGRRANLDATNRTRTRDRTAMVAPAPEANAELQKNQSITYVNAKSKSEKFLHRHQDGFAGFPLGSPHHMYPVENPPDSSSLASVYLPQRERRSAWSGPLFGPPDVGHPQLEIKTSHVAQRGNYRR